MTSRSAKRSAKRLAKKSAKRLAKKSAKRLAKKSAKRSADKHKLSGYERFVNQEMKKMENDPHYMNLNDTKKLDLIKKVWEAVR
jgi:predicted metal-dependent hydrolase